MPADYPKNPPKATFRTRIYHPNVEESTGAVCLETLKRDWDPKLTLKDILITISCLLIQPNPDSALNATAGALIQEDYEAFSTQAKLMTRIHAPIPLALVNAVQDAKKRGEEPPSVQERPLSVPAPSSGRDSECEHPKENALGSTIVRGQRDNAKVKRPLMELYTSEGPEEEVHVTGNDDTSKDTTIRKGPEPLAEGPLRKSPKLIRPEAGGLAISKGSPLMGQQPEPCSLPVENDKENLMASKHRAPETGLSQASRPQVLRKVSNVGSRTPQPRVGIRRL
ncbi:ubiquitin-conjugating enzyme E2 S [Exophiala aquamarina CBS 119918]|uniref:Ubiquitin-conjugating enzyme E2 S n=1 Tax=Exophiala aquamarina CBS 119918 TaxID=1182545 RepID=A0A072P7W8_9EURO|nr:ubiquitin-conjugating enzyme E2 S [Exophiala aquamarina CBS 119918]KEF55956.1 ubiquitin-conjugating enzyme E2 S [Exophiala aquamarina CBS 119918]